MMASNHSSLCSEIGPDGLAREAPVIVYTEKVIAEEQLQLKKYIEENYSKIRDVEKELENLSFEMKLTAGPKRAALEHIRRKIEISTERLRVSKMREEEARKVWEESLKAVKDEEEIKQKLCDDLNRLVQESGSRQFERLELLKRRLEALNPARSSTTLIQESGAKEAKVGAVNGEEKAGGSVVGGRKKSVLMQERGRGRFIEGDSEWTGAGFNVGEQR